MSTDASRNSTEQRAYPRRSARRKIYFSDGRSAWRCNLVDVALGGGRVELTSASPTQPDLFLVDPGTGLVHLTREVWRSEREIGLQFIETTTFAMPLGGPAGAIKVVETFARKLAQGGKKQAR